MDSAGHAGIKRTDDVIDLDRIFFISNSYSGKGLLNWSGLSTDLSSRLSIQPVLNDSGRWRISFSIDLTQEILNLLYLTVGLNEEYDSKPPSADANKNDFRITTSLGWTY